MRKHLAAMAVVLATAALCATPANACPYCGVDQGWCVGWNQPTEFSWCIQAYNPDGSPRCWVSLGGCNETWLDVERLAPDGSLREIFAPVPEYRIVSSDGAEPDAVYRVAGCQSIVVSRAYAAAEASRRREASAVILI